MTNNILPRVTVILVRNISKCLALSICSACCVGCEAVVTLQLAVRGIPVLLVRDALRSLCSKREMDSGHGYSRRNGGTIALPCQCVKR